MRCGLSASRVVTMPLFTRRRWQQRGQDLPLRPRPHQRADRPMRRRRRPRDTGLHGDGQQYFSQVEPSHGRVTIGDLNDLGEATLPSIVGFIIVSILGGTTRPYYTVHQKYHPALTVITRANCMRRAIDCTVIAQFWEPPSGYLQACVLDKDGV
jgi:hypothetical protein